MLNNYRWCTTFLKRLATCFSPSFDLSSSWLEICKFYFLYHRREKKQRLPSREFFSPLLPTVPVTSASTRILSAIFLLLIHIWFQANSTPLIPLSRISIKLLRGPTPDDFLERQLEEQGHRRLCRTSSQYFLLFHWLTSIVKWSKDYARLSLLSGQSVKAGYHSIINRGIFSPNFLSYTQFSPPYKPSLFPHRGRQKI